MRLRLIAGKFKGRFINVPKSDLIRPMTEKVRQTIFNILNNRLSFENLVVLDLYSGSGALGFESLSRGACEIHFVEKNNIIYKNLEENIKILNAENECTIFKMPAIKFSAGKKVSEYDLIFADPPFFKDDIYNVVENIRTNGYFHEETLMIIERSIQTKEKDIYNFKIQPFKIIGDACLYELTYQNLQ